MIYPADVTPSGGDHLMLFVTGIPSKSSPFQILDHFTRFGSVKIQKLESLKKGSRVLPVNPTSNTRRGFCILQADDLRSYQNVLSSAAVPFQGRTLAISRFRQGRELLEYHEYVNSRRVIIKKVPAETNPELLEKLVERRFGSIERIYRYEAESIEKAIKKLNKRRTHTYSVEFKTIQAAETAASMGAFNLLGKGSLVHIERYNRKVKTKITQESRLDPNLLNHNGYGKDHCQQFETFPDADHVDGHPNEGMKGSIRQKAWKRDADLGRRTSEATNLIKHSFRPTRRSYHNSRQSPLDCPLTNEDGTAVRFNICLGALNEAGVRDSFRKRRHENAARESQRRSGGFDLSPKL